MIIYILLTDW